MLKKIFKSLVPDFYLDHLHKQKIDKQIIFNYENWRDTCRNEWVKKGSPLPPPHAVKQKVISEYQKKHKCKILVETGTFHGEMIEAQKRSFEKIYSIELDDKLHSEASKRFIYDRNIHLIKGDSAVQLFEVIKKINEKSIFWLDGHYSGSYTALGNLECPIHGEIDGIFSGYIKNHIILVDDARCFVDENSYPTKEKLFNQIKNYNPEYKMSVEEDIIRFEIN
jgi:hypothetical protein